MNLSKSLFKMSKKLAKSAVKDVKKSTANSIKKSKKSKRNNTSTHTPTAVPEWQVYTDKNGIPTDFYKNGKEWISVDSDYMCISPSGKYYLFYSAYYGESQSEYIALTTQNEGINKKACEIGVESAFVTDEGIGYLYSDEGDLHILTADKKSKRHLCDDPEAYVLIPNGCFVAVTSYNTSKLEGHDQVIVKGMLFDSGKTWKKAIDFESPDEEDEIIMNTSDDTILITLPDRNIVRMDFDGNIIK